MRDEDEIRRLLAERARKSSEYADKSERQIRASLDIGGFDSLDKIQTATLFRGQFLAETNVYCQLYEEIFGDILSQVEIARVLSTVAVEVCMTCTAEITDENPRVDTTNCKACIEEEPNREPSAEQERAWDEQYDGTSLGS